MQQLNNNNKEEEEKKAVISPYYVDSIEDSARLEFNSFPERLYILYEGVVVYQGRPGPWGYDIEEVARWLHDEFPNV